MLGENVSYAPQYTHITWQERTRTAKKGGRRQAAFATGKSDVRTAKKGGRRQAAFACGKSAEKELLSSRLMFPTPLASDKNSLKNTMNMNVYLSDNGIFRKINPNGAIWSLPLSAAVFYLTPVASDGIRSKLPPKVMIKSKNGANLAAQIIKKELPIDSNAALNPDWTEWLMGFPQGWTDINCGNESLRAFRV